MSFTSEVQIMNSALIKSGSEIINSPTDNSTRARLCLLRYPIIRDKLLTSHLWNFAISYAQLAPLATKPAEIYQYGYVFKIPDDCLRVIGTNLGTNEEWEELAGGYIACNNASLNIKFIGQITDVSKYSANFGEVLAFDLAIDISPSLSNSTEKVNGLVARRKIEIQEARSFDAQVGSVRRVEASEWLDSRRY